MPIQTDSPPTLVIDHIGRLVTCEAPFDGQDPLGVIEDAAVVVSGGVLAAVGPRRQVRPEAGWPLAASVIDARGRVVTPGFVDCHTHLCFGGDRRAEYALRREGVSYATIAEQGGGILSTVQATRQALRECPEQLAESVGRRLDHMLIHGTTTAEVKSGYGLSTETELAILRLYRSVDRGHPVDLVPTFLGAHDIPLEFRSDGEAGRLRFVELLCQESLPAVAGEGLARFCDIFCEKGAFTLEESRRVLCRGIDLGLGAKIHCDQFHSLGGTRLAAEIGAVSVDHLHVTAPADASALAAGGTVPVGLPGVTYFLGLSDATPWKEFYRAGAPMALATDWNPGTCMTGNPQAIASIASSRWRMPDSLILRGLTIEAARAIGRAQDLGSVAIGKQADVLVLDCRHEGELMYHFGVNHVDTVVKAGRIVVCGGRRV